MESSAKSRTAGAAGWIGGRDAAPPAADSRRIRGPRHEALQDPWRLVRTDRHEPLRRAVNVSLALVGLVVAAPLMVLIALLVKLTSRGPVLYTQERVGLDRRSVNPEELWDPHTSSNGDGPSRSGRHAPPTNGHKPSSNGHGGASSNGHGAPSSNGRGAPSSNGHGAASTDRSMPTLAKIEDQRSRDRGGRTFTIYKFRTMRVDSGDEQIWADPDDDRVTPVGRILRTLHLDELPQLVNVLKGDMNVVGPRPEQPEIFERLTRKIPGYRLRQRVRPGITGWAQVNHHYDRSLEDVRIKVELDLEYLRRRSPTEDLMITFQTLPAVLLGEDARGW